MEQWFTKRLMKGLKLIPSLDMYLTRKTNLPFSLINENKIIITNI